MCSRWLFPDLHRRILLSAQISHALFGLTHAPAEMSDRLRTLSESVVRMLADDMQMIRVEVTVVGASEPLRRWCYAWPTSLSATP